MKLELGKAYRSKAGEKVVVVRYEEDRAYPFRCSINGSDPKGYTETGKFRKDGNSSHDIVAVWEETTTLQLEVGKEYRTRKGEKVKIIGEEGSLNWPFVGDNFRTYSPAGQVEADFQESPGDIVALWADEVKPAPSPVPAPQPAEEVHDAAVALSQLIRTLSAQPKAHVDETRIIELIREHSSATVVRLETATETRELPTGLHHHALPDVIKMLSAGVNVMMVGPAGSGKTTIAHQAAQALGLPFYFNGALNSEYKLTGFVDANGRLVSTAFRKAYETGGVYLFDEIDASMPDALLAFNAALSNGHADFPDGSIDKHPDFRCVAAANTFGRGADRVYVGRNQLDGASLDRFCVIDIDYDEKLERALTANDNWVSHVQKIRRAVFDLKIRHVVSPRASIAGASMLAAGLPQPFVENAALFKGIDADTRKKVCAAAGVVTEEDMF